jgi:kynureninase
VTPEHATALDDADELRGFADRFLRTEDATLYLDGNSLGRTPRATRDRLRELVEVEWAGQLIRGWDHWIGLAAQAGDLLAASVLDARPGEVIVSDSTSVNLYKLASAALDARPGRTVIVTDDDNFPTDRYVLAGLAQARGLEVRVIAADPDLGVGVDAVARAVDPDTALVSLSHVAYRSGAVADLAAITATAQQAGALTLWDLSHSVGSVPVPLGPASADLAVGCTYKYLNGGPGAPGFLFVRRDLQATLRQPIWGWFGQRDQFEMGTEYDPVGGIERFQVGTPNIAGLVAVLEGTKIAAEAGINRIWAKGRALTAYAVELADAWLTPLGFALASPRDPHSRGAHVSLRHPRAWQISQALRADAIIPDFRPPDRLRLGFAPLYTSFTDVFRGLARLRELVGTEAHLAYPEARSRVT